MNKKARGKTQDILLNPREDRRLLPHVPDKTLQRTNVDRRGTVGDRKNIYDFIDSNAKGIRYRVSYRVQVTCKTKNNKSKFYCRGIDISTTGILLQTNDGQHLQMLEDADTVKLKFEIIPGTMPEGLEMKVQILAKPVRSQEVSAREFLCGLQFVEELSIYSKRKKGNYMLLISSLLLLFITAVIVLMRAESIIYFRFNKWLYLYSIIAATFLLSRYFFAIFYKEVPIDPDYTPGVSIIIPCFNEEKWIQKTILGCINQDYPIDSLEVIVVDDYSTDQSVAKIKEITQQLYQESEGFEVRERLQYILSEQNNGKRKALAQGVFKAKHNLVVFVDSDSFLDPFAIRNLVQPFKDPKIGGVSGRTEVANTYTNTLTKLQSVRYHIAFRVMKAAESLFDTVTCLSGPIACYKKEIVLENMEAWLNQRFLGYEATFGDDRAMTNLILSKHRTYYQDSALCHTIVPKDHRTFLKQQMRWKRSWLRESVIASKFIWKKEPFAALSCYIGILVPVLGPVVVTYNLLYVPLVYRIFPMTFLTGLFLMAMLLSIAQLFLRRSTTWVFGLMFVIYYEAVLLWQMPIAWVTFYKSTWGTRMTQQDIAAKKQRRAKSFNQRLFNNFRGGGQ